MDHQWAWIWESKKRTGKKKRWEGVFPSTSKCSGQRGRGEKEPRRPTFGGGVEKKKKKCGPERGGYPSS